MLLTASCICACILFIKCCEVNELVRQLVDKEFLLSYFCYSTDIITALMYKKLSYRRETARQLCSVHVYLGWLTDGAMHRTPQNRRGCTISDIQWFKRSDSRSAGRKRILSWNSRLRSFKFVHFAIICRSTRGSISSHIIACRISEVFEDVAT